MLISEDPEKILQNDAILMSPLDENDCNETQFDILHELKVESTKLVTNSSIYFGKISSQNVAKMRKKLAKS